MDCQSPRWPAPDGPEHHAHFSGCGRNRQPLRNRPIAAFTVLTAPRLRTGHCRARSRASSGRSAMAYTVSKLKVQQTVANQRLISGRVGQTLPSTLPRGSAQRSPSRSPAQLAEGEPALGGGQKNWRQRQDRQQQAQLQHLGEASTHPEQVRATAPEPPWPETGPMRRWPAGVAGCAPPRNQCVDPEIIGHTTGATDGKPTDQDAQNQGQEGGAAGAARDSTGRNEQDQATCGFVQRAGPTTVS